MQPLSLKDADPLITEVLGDASDRELDLRREEDRQASILIPLLLAIWWRSLRLNSEEERRATEQALFFPESAFIRATQAIETFIRDRFVPGLLDAAQRGSDSARDAAHRALPAVPFSQVRAQISTWLQARGLSLAHDLTERQRQNLAILLDSLVVQRGMHPRSAVRIVERAIGLTERQQASLVRHVAALQAGGLTGRPLEQAAARYLQQQLQQRAETIVRTETVNAFVGGQDSYTREAMREAGIPTYRVLKRWLTAKDERVCNGTCEAMEGVTVPLDQPFQVPLPKRKKDVGAPRFMLLMTPGAHPRCRCILVYLVVGGLADAADPLT